MARRKPTRRTYRDARGRFTTKAKFLRAAIRKAVARPKLAPKARPRYTREEERLLADLRKPLRGRVLPAGTEFEFTATTMGGTPDRTRGGRVRKKRRRYAR